MATLVSNWDAVQSRLDALARQHGVPGASLAILDGDEFVEFATGVTSTATGVEVTPDTLFQIGSNTKVYTATLVMQLVDAGQVDLDAPVRRYVPDFRVPGITVRHLITHTSGLAGDYFEEFGPGDDAIERYVAALSNLALAHPTGAMFSYSNSGFVLAGRVVEKVTGAPYRLALRDRLLRPIGALATTVMPEEMLGHRYAVGHMPGATGATPARRVLMSPTQSPAGSVTSATARDVITFVRVHLDGGKAMDGTVILSRSSVEAMQQPQVKLPPSGRSAGSHVGLSWMVEDWGSERIIGHNGGTLGQLSFLEVAPDRRFAVCLLTNSMSGGLLWQQLGRYLFDELAGIEMPRPAHAPDTPIELDLHPYAGRYERVGATTEVKVEANELVVTMTPTGSMAEFGAPPQTMRFQALEKAVFVGPLGMVMSFLDFDRRGRPAYLHMGRASHRVAARPGTAKPPAAKVGNAKSRTTKAPIKRAATRPGSRTSRRR